MSYARWATKKEIIERTEKINLNTSIKEASLPIMYDNEFLYIDKNHSHSLVIGATGSGKTQSIILPMLKMSYMANNSIVIGDRLGNLYRENGDKLKEEGYHVVVLDFENAKFGNAWNPLKVPYDLYKEGDFDKAFTMVEEISYYLFYDGKKTNPDPFWTNSVMDYFNGLVFYLFDHAKEEEIHIASVSSLSEQITSNSNFINSLSKDSKTYAFLKVTLLAPNETRESILSIFNQKIKKYTLRDNLSNMLSYSDFDLTNIGSQKTALFIISGNSSHSNNLVPLLINHLIECVSIFGNKQGINILLDEFDDMVPIKDFAMTLNITRALHIQIIATIKSYAHLCNMYSKEEADILKMCFGNIVYLLSDDIYTLEEISKYCGTKEVDGKLLPLITVEELKTLDYFEAIILMSRTMPIKTKLLPDYQIDYGYKNKLIDVPTRQEKIIVNYQLKN